jgi:NTP pyrophosphatase (non-canonical NTP hydrolase)
MAKSLEQMADQVFNWAVSKGWEPEPTRTFGDECALIHSEVSEALEAFRAHGFESWDSLEIPTSLALECTSREEATDALKKHGVIPKPEGVASEFADTFIRLIHYCKVHNIDLEAEFDRKMLYNEKRAYRHGNKAL